MTLTLKARDLLLAALLLAIGVLIGLAFNAAPSRAQSVGPGNYVSTGGTVYYCQERLCYSVFLYN